MPALLTTVRALRRPQIVRRLLSAPAGLFSVQKFFIAVERQRAVHRTRADARRDAMQFEIHRGNALRLLKLE